MLPNNTQCYHYPVDVAIGVVFFCLFVFLIHSPEVILTTKNEFERHRSV